MGREKPSHGNWWLEEEGQQQGNSPNPVTTSTYHQGSTAFGIGESDGIESSMQSLASATLRFLPGPPRTYLPEPRVIAGMNLLGLKRARQQQLPELARELLPVDVVRCHG